MNDRPKTPLADPALSLSGIIPTGSWKQFPSHTTPDQSHHQKRRPSVQFVTQSLHKRNVLNSSQRRKLPLAPSTVGRFRIERNRLDATNDFLKRRLADSFEINQSFPVVQFPTCKDKQYELNLITPPLRKKFIGMDKIRVDGANGLRFSARRKGCFTPGTGSPYAGQSSSFVAPSSANAVSAFESSASVLRVQQAGINPNKAVFTIDSKTSQILIVNNNACELLGHTPRELCEMLFSDLLTNKNRTHVSALAEGQLNSEDGTMVLLSGKVVEMNTKYGTKVAVSLWIRQIDTDGRCLAVAEPVERRVAQILVDRNGSILSGDYEALMLFQLESIEHFCGMDIGSLIPAILLPDADNSLIAKHVRKQKATGKTTDGVNFPLCLMISAHADSTGSTADSADSGVSNNSAQFIITIWVFQNISGLLVIDEKGFIESCNHHFSMLMFGYSQMKVLGRHITDLVPNFGQDVEYLGEARSRNATNSSVGGQDEGESETETDPVYYENEAFVMSEGQTQPEVVEEIAKTKSEPVNISLEAGSNASYDLYPNIEPLNRVPSPLKDLCKSVTEHMMIRSTHKNTMNRSVPNTQISSHQSIQRPDGFISMSLLETNTELSMANYKEPQQHSIVDSLQISDSDINNSSSMLFKTCSGSMATSNTPNFEVTNSSSHHDYQLADISEALRSVEMSIENRDRATMDSPKFTPQHSDTGLLRLQLMTSTPDNMRRNQSKMPPKSQPPILSGSETTTPVATPSKPGSTPTTFVDGRYKGEAIHLDENVLDILYTISSQTLPCGRRVFCVWICRDPDLEYELDDDDGRHQNLTLTFNSIASTIENSLGAAIKHTAAQNSSRPNSVSMLSQCEEDQCNGEFHKHYTTLKQIGKGAYGYVKMAYRHTDRLLVVTKFIRKDKLTSQVMCLTEDKRSVPMEIYFLTTVKHPNIVTIYDVFENEKFYQMVMEKHGSGMDLFEFIDRQPRVDEELGCFIFRQIVNAVDYLHSLNILHRDIKDENIIIDQHCHVKLIDFGSATYMEEGKLFSTFYGTTEYCSPEVLAGNKYAGPELEIWSLGITLFVLMFFENPFLDIEDTLHAELWFPNWVSYELRFLLQRMLDKNPKTRCTMRQLQSDKWIQQEILTPVPINFCDIVHCEPHESHPEKYFEGPVYSSTTALSTMSPQDSLSLVDEDDGRGDDSIIDAEEEIGDEDDGDELQVEDEEEEEEEEEEEVKSQMSQDEPQGCEHCDAFSVKPRPNGPSEQQNHTSLFDSPIDHSSLPLAGLCNELNWASDDPLWPSFSDYVAAENPKSNTNSAKKTEAQFVDYRRGTEYDEEDWIDIHEGANEPGSDDDSDDAPSGEIKKRIVDAAEDEVAL